MFSDREPGPIGSDDLSRDSTALPSPDGGALTVSRVTTAPPDAVWGVLADGWSYAMWVVGASRIRAVDPDWPHLGARIHHSFGLWPVVVDDVTKVTGVRTGHELELEARAMPFGRARIVVRIKPSPRGSVIEMVEHAVSAPASWAPMQLQLAAVYPRNVEAVRRLALLAERASDPT